MPAGPATSGLHIEQNDEHHNVENHDADTINEKNSVGTDQAEENCELLNEAYVEVPIVTETDSITTSSQNSFGIQPAPDPTQPSPKKEVNSPVTRKQPVRKMGRNNRKRQRTREK